MTISRRKEEVSGLSSRSPGVPHRPLRSSPSEMCERGVRAIFAVAGRAAPLMGLAVVDARRRCPGRLRDACGSDRCAVRRLGCEEVVSVPFSRCVRLRPLRSSSSGMRGGGVRAIFAVAGRAASLMGLAVVDARRRCPGRLRDLKAAWIELYPTVATRGGGVRAVFAMASHSPKAMCLEISWSSPTPGRSP